MRGLMIDCSRLIEQHGYYTRLLEQIADWGYDTLVLHFCDDHGLSAVLPGFEEMAAPHALTTAELRDLVALGKQRGVRVIPEIECFGHARWLVGHPKWDACFAGDRDEQDLKYNAVDPVSPLTAELMDRLIGAICQVFTDEIIHIGCDEVDLGDFCQRRGLGDPLIVWADWVNRLIAMVHARGRRAMLWADHLEKEEVIATRIDKRAIVVSWHYSPTCDKAADGMRKLVAAGFTEVVAAPAIQCYSTRIHAQKRNLVNVAMMENHARAVGAIGTIDTIWCPFRHLQGALWHGIAAASHIHRTGHLPLDDGAIVADLLFGGGNAAARRLCRDLHRLDFHFELFGHLYRGDKPGPGVVADALDVVHLGADLLPAIAGAEVPRNRDRLEAMVLGARTAVHLSHRLLRPELATDAAFRRDHARLTAEIQAEWDRTRFADDPARSAPRWGGNWGYNYLLPLMLKLQA